MEWDIASVHHGSGACQSLPVSVTKVTEISKEEKIYMIIRRGGLLLKVLEGSSLWLLSLVLFRPVVSTVWWKPEVCVCVRGRVWDAAHLIS